METNKENQLILENFTDSLYGCLTYASHNNNTRRKHKQTNTTTLLHTNTVWQMIHVHIHTPRDNYKTKLCPLFAFSSKYIWSILSIKNNNNNTANTFQSILYWIWVGQLWIGSCGLRVFSLSPGKVSYRKCSCIRGKICERRAIHTDSTRTQKPDAYTDIGYVFKFTSLCLVFQGHSTK